MTERKQLLAEITADIATLESTLKFLKLNPKYDDGSNQRELYRKQSKLAQLKQVENELQFALSIKSKNNLNGTRNFLAVDHVNMIYSFSTSASTEISYDRIKNVSKVTTENALKAEAAKLQAAGYRQVFSDEFTDIKEGGR